MIGVVNVPSVLSASEIRNALAAYYDYDLIRSCDARHSCSCLSLIQITNELREDFVYFSRGSSVSLSSVAWGYFLLCAMFLQDS